MDALPDTKMLNQMRYDDIRAMQKLIDPPLLVQRETSISSTRTSAGSVIYYKSGEKPESLKTGGDYQIAMDAEEKQRQMIMQCFYADLFAIFAQIPDNLQMTATEVRERVEERLMLLGPSLGRLQVELYNPMLSRCLDPLPRRLHRSCASGAGWRGPGGRIRLQAGPGHEAGRNPGDPADAGLRG
jgi:hypothetical protein